MHVHAHAAMASKQTLVPHEYDLGNPGPDEVFLEVTHCGICHTDVAMVDNEWGFSRYPVVPGHEVVGRVVAVGSAVTQRHIGQRVGVGALCGSCMACEWCERGAQHVCPNVVGTVMGEHRGGFGSIVRVDHWRFAHPIPDAIASEHAGPLLCAGTTVFTPLLRHGVRPTDRVAVVGIGGLGHLAVQYLAKWGCEVTAISSTHDKDEQAHGFGARHFIATRGTDELKKAARSFDFILSTVSADLPWDDYLTALRPQGTLCIVGIPDKPVSFVSWNLIGGEKSIVGGQPGSLTETRQMLEFTALHGVRPLIETFAMKDVNAALDHTRQGKARFRSVLVA
ncbi:MAG: NAD(P)-dependent alcohol dehydrogenase [Myxococcales bacterium]|nr:MAG: NAD(P)-dependent alcohol dehydrogenase [Myxococcales bacterium]